MKQLQLILNVLGVPTRQELSWVDNPKAVNWICTLSGKRVPFQTLFPNYRSKRGLDFLEKLLVFNPANRMTVQQALEHPFLSKSSHYHKKEQTTCKKTFDMSYETPTIEIEDIRSNARWTKVVLALQMDLGRLVQNNLPKMCGASWADYWKHAFLLIFCTNRPKSSSQKHQFLFFFLQNLSFEILTSISSNTVDTCSTPSCFLDRPISFWGIHACRHCNFMPVGSAILCR